MTSSLENLAGTGKPLAVEPMDSAEFEGLLRSGRARLFDARNASLALESRFDLAYNAAHALCLAALRREGYRTMTDRLYGVICDNTGFLVFLDYAPDPEAACRLATSEATRWGALGSFKRSLMGAPKDDGCSWLELSVYDVTGVLEPDLDPIPDDESLMCAMDEENFAARFIAEQLS